MNEDFVVMGEKVCPVCGITHTDSGEILFHSKLRTIAKDQRVNGMDLCKDHKTLYQENYVACIEVNNTGAGSKLKFLDANRTGDLVHIRREILSGMLNITVPLEASLLFIDKQAYSRILDIAGFALEEQSEH